MTITDFFREAVAKEEGGVVIIAGSNSDKKHIEEIVENLERYSLPYEVCIASAHKQPSEVLGLISEYDGLHVPLAYITIAGGTDALSGMVAQHSLYPVISCPPDAPNESCVKNPPGSSNAYVAHPKNAARFVAQMFSFINGKCERALKEELKSRIITLETADRELQKAYAERQLAHEQK